MNISIQQMRTKRYSFKLPIPFFGFFAPRTSTNALFSVGDRLSAIYKKLGKRAIINHTC